MPKFLLLLIVLLATPCQGEVRLPKVLAPGMVLQQQSEVRIWGWAAAGERVTVRGGWLSEGVVATADSEGRWQVQLKTGPAGGPHSIRIQGENQIELSDILFGEVWIASGQSNMEMPLIKVSNAYTGIRDAAREVAAADYPEIRLFQAGNFSSREPLDDVKSGITMYGIPPAACRWQACTPETVPTFSSTAYFFARHLHRELQVPIGIIDASWGGTPAEAWTPSAGLAQLGYDAALKQAENRPQQPDQKIPTRLYNGMIHPLRKLTIKGAIWYQGEGNAGRAGKYQVLFSTMISQWREAFESQFSFYFVQIAPYNYRGLNSAYLREAQLKTLSVPRTGMAVTMDIGNLQDIHPKNKQEVGRRLALWALAQDYGRELVYSGPLLSETITKGNMIRLRFDHADGGLATRDGQPPSQLVVAGSDRVFHHADARIEGSELVVSSPHVPDPVAVRYAFRNGAMANLINRAGLPASSFRTDSW